MILAGSWLLRSPDRDRSRALSLLPWSAPVLLSLGMFFLWLDLEHPFNAWRFYVVFKPASPMSWGSWILLAIYPASILLAWVLSPEDVRARGRRAFARVPGLSRVDEWALANAPRIAIVSIVAGAALGIYTGVLLGTMAARPLWNSAILGPLFLVSGLSTGAAFMLLYRLREDERAELARIDTVLIAVEIALLGLWLAGLLSGGAASRAAAGQLIGGPYTAAFWTLVVVLGLLIPLLAEWIEHRRGMVPGRSAAILVLLGGFALRWILVDAGQYAGWVTGVVSP
jgi:formate-dependent nitrite reductase membrane component NrfD